MSSDNDATSTPSSPSNAFDRRFLSRLDERDEPPTAGEADVAGPWAIVELPGRGCGLFREGEDPARGHRPYAVFLDRWLALLAAAVLPGTSRDPLFHLSPEPGPEGFAIHLDSGEVVGHVENFDQPLVEAMNGAVALVLSPLSFANLGEAAGAITLDRAGAILDARVRPVRSAAP